MSDTPQCAKRVYGPHSFKGHPCRKPVWKEGWCKVHHPDSVAKRRAASDARWKAKQEGDPMTILKRELAAVTKERDEARAALREMLDYHHKGTSLLDIDGEQDAIRAWTKAAGLK